MNNSWGCPVVEGCDPGTFLQAVRALRMAGVFMVVSTGNSGDGGCGSVTDPPAIYEEVLSVGAVNAFKQRTSFSSMGPVTVDGSNRVKPDIMAPGGDVLSAYPGGTYEEASGTSMAGPHLAGVVALMWSANPGLVGDIDRTTRILQDTAMKIVEINVSCGEGAAYPSNATGYGIVDAYEAVKQALND
jgi:subtilisin family serine protease